MQAAVTDEISAISDAIAERIGQQKFRVWFKNSIRLSISDDYVKVGVPNLFIGGWIEDHFSTDIHSAVKRVTGGERKLIFNVDPELAGLQRRAQLDSQAKLVGPAANRLYGHARRMTAVFRMNMKIIVNHSYPQ